MAVQPVGRRESVYWPTLIPGTSVIEPLLVPLSTTPKASPREALAAPIPAHPANAKAKSLRLITNIRHLLERATKKAGGSYSRQRPRSTELIRLHRLLGVAECFRRSARGKIRSEERRV